MRNTMRRFVLAAAFGFLASGAAKAGIVLEYTSANTDSSAGYTLGWSFTTTQAVSVTALDVWSGSSIGGQTSFNVRLYNSAGTTLRSATVLNTDPIEGAPTTFYTHAVTPLALAASTTYYIAMDEDPTFTNATFVQEGASGLTTNSGITYGSAVAALGFGTNPTSLIVTNPTNPAWFGPNFDVASVPEPSSMILLVLAVGGVGFTASMRRRRGVAAAV